LNKANIQDKFLHRKIMDYQSEDHSMQERGRVGEIIPASGLINNPLIIRDILVRIIIFYILLFIYRNVLKFIIFNNIGTNNIVILLYFFYN